MVIEVFRQIARPGNGVFRKRLNKDICSGMEHRFIEDAVKRYRKQMTVLSAQAKQDEDLKYYLGVNQREGFPFLMFMVDSFTRDKARYYHKSKGEKSLSIAEWAQKNKFLQALKKHHPQRFDSLQAAMKSYNARIMNRLQFNTTYLIIDNLRQIAEYGMLLLPILCDYINRNQCCIYINTQSLLYHYLSKSWLNN